MQYFTVTPFSADMPLDAGILVFAPLIVLAAYVIFGVAGFGSTLVAVPLLAHLVPLVFVFTTIARIGVFALAGLFTTDVFLATGLLLPAMALGLWSGNRLHGKLSREQAVRLVGVLLTVTGASLLLRAL